MNMPIGNQLGQPGINPGLLGMLHQLMAQGTAQNPGGPMMPLQGTGDAAQRGYRGLSGNVNHAQPPHVYAHPHPYVSPIIAAAAGQAEQRQPADLPNGWFGDTSGIPAAALAAIIQRLAHQSQRGGFRPV